MPRAFGRLDGDGVTRGARDHRRKGEPENLVVFLLIS